MPSEWYCSRDDQKIGPVSTEQLRQAAISGKLLPTDLVWKEGMPEWAQAKRLKGLFPESMPQPLPQTPLSQSNGHTFQNQIVFAPVAGETVIRSGFASSYATCYLTDRRFVVCAMGLASIALLGPVLSPFWKKTKITFQVPWEAVASIRRTKVLGFYEMLLFKTVNAEEYKVRLSFKKRHWYAAIQRLSGISF